jgi:N-acetyltransferase
MLSDLRPVVLEGKQVFLEPLATEHTRELLALGADESMWRFLPRAILSEEDAEQFVANALTKRLLGSEFAFAVRLSVTGALIGSTRYEDIQPRHGSVEIGWTFVHPSYLKTGAGTESQFLLVQHAIEDLGASRVWFKTDGRNLRIQKLLERSGVTREGVLRRHMCTRNGFLRDSVIYSILPEEWPDVKQRVRKVLERFAEIQLGRDGRCSEVCQERSRVPAS